MTKIYSLEYEDHEKNSTRGLNIHESFQKRTTLWIDVTWHINQRWYFPLLEKGQIVSDKDKKFWNTPSDQQLHLQKD